MTKHDFIFSSRRRHRMARHVAFWTVWCLTYLLLFHYPIHSFKGWHFPTSPALNPDASKTFQKLGLFPFVIKTLVFNALLATVVPQALFTYVMLYYLLPNYFFKRRSLFITIGVCITVLLIYYVAAVHFKYMTVVGNVLFGAEKGWTPYSTLLKGAPFSVIRELLISLPIVVGFALMIKLMKRWWLKHKEAEQLANEKKRAELQLLKAQVHPHFLFNTLNNIYYFTLTGSSKAPEVIHKLSGLLHYILNECNQPLVPLQKELAMIRDYTALEKIRYGEQMKMNIDIQDNGSEKLIAPLLLIPFVENSFKHGVSKMLAHPWVTLRISIENNHLHFFISNSRPPETETQSKKGNIGLKNVQKRLQLLYPNAHELNIVSEHECFSIYLKVQLQESFAASAKEGLKTTAAYAMA